MKLFSLIYKNILVNWWRTLTLGSFLFFVSFILVFFGCFLYTFKNNVRDALVNALVGDIQVRPAATKEDDMITMKTSWDNTAYLDQNQVAAVENIIKNQIHPVDYTKRVRQNALFISDLEKKPAMIIGLEPGSSAYQKNLKLIAGRYLDPKSSNEVILTEEQAKLLKVKVGDSIGAFAQTKDGYSVDIPLTVAGIGDLQMLTGLRIPVAYTDIASSRKLMGFEAGEVTDIIIQLSAREKAVAAAQILTAGLKQPGITPQKVKITTWNKMGGFVMSGISIYMGLFYGFVIVLMLIISILIVNLIYMIGLERRQEIGTMKAIGFSRSKITKIFMGEIIIISTFFSLIGIAAGTALVLFFRKTGIETGPPWDSMLGKHFVMQLDFKSIIPGLILIFGLVIIAAFYPSFKASSIKPAETLREI